MFPFFKRRDEGPLAVEDAVFTPEDIFVLLGGLSTSGASPRSLETSISAVSKPRALRLGASDWLSASDLEASWMIQGSHVLDFRRLSRLLLGMACL